MQVVQIGKYYSPVRGGIERVVQSLSESLVNEGHQVSCFVSSYSLFTSAETIKGVKLTRFSTFFHFFSLPMTLWKKKEIENLKPDLLQIHIPNPIALLIYRNVKCKKVVFYHANYVGHKWIQGLYNYILRQSIKNYDVVLFSSEKLLESSAGILKNVDIVKKVTPFSASYLSLNNKSDELAREGIEAKISDIVFVGRLVKYKGLKYLIKAMSDVNFSLAIIGDGPEKKSLLELITELSLFDRVKIYSDINDSELKLFYQNTKVVVLPSIEESEAFGLSLLEGLSFGKSLVSTKLNTGIDGINVHGETGLQVRTKNWMDLADSLNLILKDSSLRKKFEIGAKKHYKVNYSSECILQNTLM